MSCHELAFQANKEGYVRNWGFWEAIRELVQNWLDAKDEHPGRTHEIKCGGDHRGGFVLKFRNEGVKLERRHLTLGGTGKAGSSTARGQFGEGMKLAWIVLMRMGFRIRIVNDDEIWEVSTRWSEAFETEVPVVEIKKRPGGASGGVEVQVAGLPDSSAWDELQHRLLALKTLPESSCLDGGYRGRLILDPAYRNQLFVKGLYVGKLPFNSEFGYELNTLELDRDRSVADSWDVRQQAGYLIARLVEMGKMTIATIWNILTSFDGDGLEVQAIANYGAKYTELGAQVAAYFDEKYGTDAIPVTSMGQALTASQYGLTGIVLPPLVVNYLAARKGDFESLCDAREKDVARIVELAELTPTELRNFGKVATLFEGAGVELAARVRVVEFAGQKLLGLYRGDGEGEIDLARRLLADPAKLFAVALHEVAHTCGADGSAEHRQGIESLSACIALRLPWSPAE